MQLAERTFRIADHLQRERDKRRTETLLFEPTQVLDVRANVVRYVLLLGFGFRSDIDYDVAFCWVTVTVFSVAEAHD
jgi:hypothetical protein